MSRRTIDPNAKYDASGEERPEDRESGSLHSLPVDIELSHMTEAISQIGGTLDKWWKGKEEEVERIFKELYSLTQDAYKKAGWPYSNSHEGLLQWLRDLEEIKQHEEAIAAIHQRHKDLVALHRTRDVPIIRKPTPYGLETLDTGGYRVV